MFESFIQDYRAGALGQLCEGEPLRKHTTFRVGGCARVLVVPDSKEALVRTVELVREYGLNFKIWGKGSNILASDDEFLGVVIKTDKALDYFWQDGVTITVGAGASTVKLARLVAKLNLAGLEFVSGIPGTVGGAVFMNAGAYNLEVKDILIRTLILDEEGNLRYLTNVECEFAYRKSIFQSKPGWIVIETELQLEQGDCEEINKLIKLRKARRIASQPLDKPSAGSTFRNPDGHAAWKLVEDAGLRGKRIGGAMVSEKHCNFVINAGDATAADIGMLVSHVQAIVLNNYGVYMHTEVEFFNWNES